MSQEITINRIGRTLHIRLDRTDKRNAVTRSMYEAMTEAIAIAETDPTIRTVLFSGAGDAFCAGNDLNDFVGDPPTRMDSPAFRFLLAISTAQKILVAAVHGAAVGVGTTMLLHCDLVVAGRSAKLSLPFVALGLVPEAASTLLLPRAIGHLCKASCPCGVLVVPRRGLQLGYHRVERQGERLHRQNNQKPEAATEAMIIDTWKTALVPLRDALIGLNLSRAVLGALQGRAVPPCVRCRGPRAFDMVAMPAGN